MNHNLIKIIETALMNTFTKDKEVFPEETTNTLI